MRRVIGEENEREREKRSRTQAFKEIYEVLFRCQIIPRRVPVMGMRMYSREEDEYRTE